MTRALLWISLPAAVLLLLFCAGCFTSGNEASAPAGADAPDSEPSDPDDVEEEWEDAEPGELQEAHWYNTDVFRPLLGDFDPAFGFSIHDYREVKILLGQGAYLTKVAACGSCHGAKPADENSPLSGGREITDSYGRVFAANITPDIRTGIGGWNVGEIGRAIRASIDRKGRALSLDVHEGYRWMSDRDTKAIALYLLSKKPVVHEVERRDLGGFKRRKWGLISQHEDFHGYVPALAAKPTPQYGRYLTHYVAGCKRCHTPDTGVESGEKLLAGNQGKRRGLFSALGRLLELANAEPDHTPEKQGEIRSLLSPEGESIFSDQLSEPQEETFGDAITKNVSDFLKPLSAPEVDDSFPQLGPDIRGNSPDGLADWDLDDITSYLAGGRKPDGTVTDPELCPWNYFRGLNDLDRRAIALYLKSL